MHTVKPVSPSFISLGCKPAVQIKVTVSPTDHYMAMYNADHNILVEKKTVDELTGEMLRTEYIVRDACCFGHYQYNIKDALESYIRWSKLSNKSRVGFCDWMMGVCLPHLENNMDILTSEINAAFEEVK